MLLATVMTFVACKWREAYYQAYGLFKKYNEFIKNGAREFFIVQEIVDNDFNVGKVHVEATNDKGISFVIKTSLSRIRTTKTMWISPVAKPRN